jgi:hypothetical protein
MSVAVAGDIKELNRRYLNLVRTLASISMKDAEILSGFKPDAIRRISTASPEMLENMVKASGFLLFQPNPYTI